jgi:hypothetical protein
MSDDTYRWLTGVVTPVLTVIVTVILTGIVALLATRAEAARAERRARDAELRAERLRSLNETYDAMLRTLYVAFNSVMPPDQHPLIADPLTVDYPLIGDPEAIIAYMKFLSTLIVKPVGGVGQKDLAAFGDVVDGLRNAASRQRDRILEGKEPVIPAGDRASAVALQTWHENWARMSPKGRPPAAGTDEETPGFR